MRFTVASLMKLKSKNLLFLWVIDTWEDPGKSASSQNFHQFLRVQFYKFDFFSRNGVHLRHKIILRFRMMLILESSEISDRIFHQS